MSTTVKVPSIDRDGSDRWPERVIALCRERKDARDDRQRQRILSDVWLLIDVAIAGYIQLHIRSCGFVDSEGIRDIASDKTIALLRALEDGQLDLAALKPAQLCTYVSVVARNGLVDFLRKGGKGERIEYAANAPFRSTAAPQSDSAEINVEHQQFLIAIGDCIALMTPRAQRVWFMRAFLDMPSTMIGLSENVSMTRSAVDMLLSRTRRALRDCMIKKGFGAEDAPPGTLMALWEHLRFRFDSGDEQPMATPSIDVEYVRSSRRPRRMGLEKRDGNELSRPRQGDQRDRTK